MAIYYVSTIGRNTDPGTLEKPWRTIAKANSVLNAGDTVYIRGGTYAETISPAVSGQLNARITYMAYNSEAVKVTGSKGADLNGKSYISIDGLIFEKNSWQFFLIRNGANHAEIKNCMIDGKGTGGGGPYNSCEVVGSLYAHIHHCTFQNPFRATIENGNEKNFLGISGASDNTLAYALIEHNTFKDGPGHEQVDLYRTSYNIVRFNTFLTTGLYTENFQESVSVMVGMGRGAEHNVVEYNEFYETGGNLGDGNCFGIRLSTGSKHCIIRHNLIYDIDRNSISLGTSENRNTEYNAVYNNTIHNSGSFCKGTEANIQLTSKKAGSKLRFNSLCNNIVHAIPKTGIIIYDNSTTWANVYENEFRANIIQGIGTDVTKGVNVDYSWINIQRYTIQEAQNAFPAEFKDNIDVDPLFENATGYDFRLKASSPAIDAGDWLTNITSTSGTGVSFKVDNAQFFMDGFGIVQGDLIQLEGQTQRAKITNVDYDNNIITVDTNLSWTNGLGVALSYEGSAPDIGAIEYTDVSDPCEGVVCENVCVGLDLWSQKCVDGYCVPDQLIESNSASCGYDPCVGVVCDNVCFGLDLWSLKCVDGDCVPDQLLESNSVTCGYDPCEGVVCGNICIGLDLWSQKCVEGDCVPDQLLESNSVTCELCEGVVCGNICIGDDLWSQLCDPDTGTCVANQLLQQDSINCKIPDQVPSDESTINTYIILGGFGLMGLAMLILRKK